VLGLLAHLLKKLKEARTAGLSVTAIGYIANHPYHSGLSVIGVIIGLLMAEQTGTLNGLTAFGCGYMANSMVDVIGNRAKAVIPK